jgi:N-acylneuraminate cytidylyltransferase
LIPARGGSKGIKNKNLTEIEGKSLVGHSITHSLESKLIQRTFLSSDSDLIIAEGIKYGAEVPFVRPAELAEDHVLDIPVFQHLLAFLKEKENYIPDIVVHLRPTAPYRNPQWIDDAIQLLIDHPEADSVRSVSEPGQHPYRVFTLDEKGFLNPIMKAEHPQPYLLRRQDLPTMYFYNCVIDVTRTSTITEQHSMTGSKIYPYIMDANDVIDIDTPLDLEFARFYLHQKSKK